MARSSSVPRPAVLVVGPDAGSRIVPADVGSAAQVTKAGSLARARELLGSGAPYGAAVIDADLPDGDGLALVPEVRQACPDAVVVVVSGVPAPGPVAMASRASPAPAPPQLAAVELLRAELDDVVREWQELCRWDPTLPPGSQAPIAASVILAVADALRRPQPLGWGGDPEIEKVAEVFATAAGSLEVALAQLVCLREALCRHVEGRVPEGEQAETLSRLTMLVERAIGVAATRTEARLDQRVDADPLTGLLNRRAFHRDLGRETGRAARHGRSFTVMAVELEGLDAVNDTEGHVAGDGRLRALAGAMGDAVRVGDEAYRTGGDDFVVLLPETGTEAAAAVARRLEAFGAPPFAWGAASFPDDGDDADGLLATAHQQLSARRAGRLGP